MGNLKLLVCLNNQFLNKLCNKCTKMLPDKQDSHIKGNFLF